MHAIRAVDVCEILSRVVHWPIIRDMAIACRLLKNAIASVFHARAVSHWSFFLLAILPFLIQSSICFESSVLNVFYLANGFVMHAVNWNSFTCGGCFLFLQNGCDFFIGFAFRSDILNIFSTNVSWYSWCFLVHAVFSRTNKVLSEMRSTHYTPRRNIFLFKTKLSKTFVCVNGICDVYIIGYSFEEWYLSQNVSPSTF